MSKLVRGDQLPSNLRNEVLSRYLYRWTSDNSRREHAWRDIKGAPTIPLISDAQWLREHAFYVTDRGTLDKRRTNAEPAYLVEDKTRHATKKTPAQLQREIDAALATGQGRGRGRGRGAIGSWTQRGNDWVSEDKRFSIRGDSTGKRWHIVDLDTYDEADAPSFIEATRAAKIMRGRRRQSA